MITNFTKNSAVIKNIAAITLICLFAGVSVAQNKRPDPRVLKGLDVSKIPIMKSFKDLKPEPGGLLKNAQLLGAAEFVYTDISTGKELSKDESKGDLLKDFSIWRVDRAKNGTVNWMWAASTKQHGQTTQSVKTVDGYKILEGLKTALRIADPKSEFQPMSNGTGPDDLGYQHLRYAQYYKGIPVWNRDLYIHIDAGGEPYIINGTYEPTPKNIDVAPSISEAQAIDAAVRDLKLKNRWAPVSADVAKALGEDDQPTAKLVIYPDQNGSLHLAYEVSVIPNLLESYFYIVDAHTNEVIHKIQRSCSIVPPDQSKPPVTISHFNSSNGNAPLQPESGFADATATDLNGVAQSLRVYQHTDGLYYAIWDLPGSFDPTASKLPDQPSGGAATYNLKNQDYNDNSVLLQNTSANNTWTDPVVVSAHHNTKVTYDYYHNTFARKAIDDKNGTINSVIHVTENGAGMDNAFWTGTGKIMIWGDGNVDFKPLAGAIDVAGHEMTHGVINNTCDLVYEFQSGALNESMADVFGCMVDTRNLTLGEDIMLPSTGKTCLRDMNNPHSPNALADQPAKMSEFLNMPIDQDQGGVHENSGITNHACAILINKFGRDEVQKMYYLAITKYLTRSSQFIDCRYAVQSAAKELFGATSTEYNYVGLAFDTVEITGAATNPGQDDLPAQTGGTQYIAFTNVNGLIGLLDPVQNKFAMENNGAATARVSDSGFSRAQLTAPRSGKDIWFINQTGHLTFLEVATGKVFGFPNLNLKADGDLWNAAVSPDEVYVAMTSAYDNDPNIYIFDGKNIYTQPLKPESQDGGAVASIDYPDVVSWSPNINVPKIGFDAFLNTNVAGTDVSYWSMYEINYTSKKIYDLVPSQTSDIDIGNISYSSTSPNVITFNVISGGMEDVAVADFKNNLIGTLGVNKFTINNNPIPDADKPSFSPNDGTLAFSSVANSSLLFFDGSTQKLSYLQFQSPVFMPCWFLLGGSAGVRNTTTASTLDLSVYPSIISGDATVQCTLSASEEITVDILNLFGQTVRKIANQRMDAGSNELTFTSEGLSSGTYFIRLASKDGQKMVKVSIEK